MMRATPPGGDATKTYPLLYDLRDQDEHFVSTRTFTVVGMTCGHCVAAVKEEVSKLDGVDQVEIDLGSGAVTVQSGGPIDFAAFASAVVDAGYRVAE